MTSRAARSSWVGMVLAALSLCAAERVDAQTGLHRTAVAARALPRGAVLTADDITYRDTTARAAAELAEVGPGWVTRRVVNAGEVLRPPAVQQPIVVSANQPVQLEYIDDMVRITIRGTAARNGVLGERIPVRTDAGRRMEGTVVAPGRIRID